MNVALILSGGSGKRFNSELPKQYHQLCGKPVIQYAIEATIGSEKIDEIVLVIDEEYKKYVNKIDNSRIHMVSDGKERLFSVKNGLDYININFPNCENVLITQAVSPLVTSELIDTYINLLNEYDVVTTAEKCPGELFNIKNYKKLDRNEYYFCQSPEAFKFNDLYKNLDVTSEFSELIYHYPQQPKIYYYLDFHNNVKLTYPADLEYASFLIKQNDSKSKEKEDK